MKKLFVLAGIALLSLTANAQEKKAGLEGTWWAAGQVAFGSEKTGDVKETSSTILPVVGYFVAPTTTIGLGVGSINTKAENATTTTSETSTFVLKPVVRKYWNVSGNLFFFGQAGLPMKFGKDKISEDKTTEVNLEIAPGFDYIVNKWLTVETSFPILSVGSKTITHKVGDKTTTFGFDANPMNTDSDRALGGLQIGVKFLF